MGTTNLYIHIQVYQMMQLAWALRFVKDCEKITKGIETNFLNYLDIVFGDPMKKIRVRKDLLYVN